MSAAADFRPILAAIETGLTVRGTKTRFAELKRLPTPGAHKHMRFVLTDNEFRSPIIRGRTLAMMSATARGALVAWRLERWHNDDAAGDFPVGMVWTLDVTTLAPEGCRCRAPGEVREGDAARAAEDGTC